MASPTGGADHIPVLGVVPDFGDLGIGGEDKVPTNRLAIGRTTAICAHWFVLPLSLNLRFRPVFSRARVGGPIRPDGAARRM